MNTSYRAITKKIVSSNRKHNLGMTTIELICVLAIFGILFAGGVWGVSVMNRNTKINDIAKNTQLIHTGITELYINETSFVGLTSEIVIKAGFVPTGMIKADKKSLRSTWGDIILEVAKDDVDNDTFSLRYEKMPPEVCQRFGYNMMTNSNTWKVLSVGGTKVWDITEDNTGNSIVTKLSEACNSGVTVELTLLAKKQ